MISLELISQMWEPAGGACIVRSSLIAGLLAVGVSACGTDRTPKKPEEVASAWVAAMNDQNWNGACKLSVLVSENSGRSCAALLKRAFSDMRLRMQYEGVYVAGDVGQVFLAHRAKALSKVGLERHADKWRIHFEIQTIK